MKMLMCYNRGCGAKFEVKDNVDGVCQHHPGAPVFHDAYKGWSCCKKRSTDFTEFLNIPGCAKGLHNPEKPKKEEKPVEKPLEIGEVIKDDAPTLMKFQLPNEMIERPSGDLPKIKLKSSTAQSLKISLQKCNEKLDKERAMENDDVIQVGAPCKHNGCDEKYNVDDTSSEECIFHPGYPVFHEGYKFWTCCNKRTSDFNEFLKQSGCDVGKHEWMKPSEIAEKKSLCRYDWHQTSKNVIISIYAKCCDPEKCEAEANSTNVHTTLTFNRGVNIFDLDVCLHGVIEPEDSTVEYLGTKVEIKLRKKEGFSWPRLEYVPDKC